MAVGPEGLDWEPGVISDTFLNMSKCKKSSTDSSAQSQSHVNIWVCNNKPLLMAGTGWSTQQSSKQQAVVWNVVPEQLAGSHWLCLTLEILQLVVAVPVTANVNFHPPSACTSSTLFSPRDCFGNVYQAARWKFDSAGFSESRSCLALTSHCGSMSLLWPPSLPSGVSHGILGTNTILGMQHHTAPCPLPPLSGM